MENAVGYLRVSSAGQVDGDGLGREVAPGGRARCQDLSARGLAMWHPVRACRTRAPKFSTSRTRWQVSTAGSSARSACRARAPRAGWGIKTTGGKRATPPSPTTRSGEWRANLRSGEPTAELPAIVV